MAGYRFAVIGKGLIGSAAARHLSEWSDGVVLIGPDEPMDKRAHEGVFGSHYDEGRITRTLDPDMTWARLAKASIDRYRDLETRSGIAFFSETGFLSVATGAEGAAHLQRLHATGEALGVHPESIAAKAMSGRFPYLRFADGTAGEYEAANAGHISPRRLVEAQTLLAEHNGATIMRTEAHEIRPQHDHFVIETPGGTIEAERVLVAAGAFANTHRLLPAPLAIRPNGRTTCLVLVEERRLEALAGMPSLICSAAATGTTIGTYVLPPTLYPDGKWYVKIGSGRNRDGFDHPLATPGELGDWFRGEPSEADVNDLYEIVTGIVPVLQGAPFVTDQCAVTGTDSGYPYVGSVDDGRLCVAVGGNGTAAKSSDEIGRLGALTLMAEEWPAEYERAQFAPVFDR